MEVLLQVPEHEHRLKLIDLRLEYPFYYEEEEEEEEEEEDVDDGDEGRDPITKEGFDDYFCDRCGQDIHMYHLYYYKCVGDSSCDFTLHKFCAELPKRLDHTLHRHPLIQNRQRFIEWVCCVCKQEHNCNEMNYGCYNCYFFMDANCAVEVGKNTIHHPCHPKHSLIRTSPKPILCECSACGKRHEGIFYQCITCPGFAIHIECAFLPKTLLIQQTTDDVFYHTHPLTISYCFPIIDQEAKHNPRCRVCGDSFEYTEDLWIYKCEKCLYYAHVDCATSRREPFMSILSIGRGKTIKNFEDVDHPHLLHLPFPDETYSLPKHLFFQESESDHDHHKRITHDSHQHPLILVDIHTQTINGQTSSSSSSPSLLLMCHDPIRKTQLLCNGCLRPIMSTHMPFYKCGDDDDDQCCNFALHEWCTQLPPTIENHPGHPQHTLVLYTNVITYLFSVFVCDVCGQYCNGFAYSCIECKYTVDVNCGFIPREITHEAHPNHLLSLVQANIRDNYCHMCLGPGIVHEEGRLSFHCNTCNIYIDPVCALFLAETIRHKYDKKHPMHLSYLPIENHKSEYFCEICEEDLNPHEAFYHCQVCVQSVHTTCAPLILQCETNCRSNIDGGTHGFLNIKFGRIFLNINGHPHPCSFAQGIDSDDRGCGVCHQLVQFRMIFKCLVCNFVVHYNCCTS